jgi:tetratricopeptide (TPR) repeat protein
VTPTQVGSAIGTPQFMSPEQASGRLDELGPASDVYSLGATLYCLLTGRPAFDDAYAGAVLQKVQQGSFPAPQDVNRLVPPALEAICLRAMALRPQNRYTTPRALAEDVEHWLADEPVRAYREPWPARAGRWARRHKTAVTAAAAALLVTVLATGLGTWWLEKQRAEDRAREDETNQRALLVLERARGLLQAGWQANDEAKLKEAKVEADSAADIAANAAVTVQEQATAMQHEVEQQLARAMRNRTLLKDLLDVSAPREIGAYQPDGSGRMVAVAQPTVDEQYAAAFQRWGQLDLDRTAPPEVTARLRAEPGPVVEEIITALDAWTLDRVQQKRPKPEWRRLMQVAELLDQSGRRQRLRSLLAAEPRPREEIVAGLTRVLLPWTALCEMEHGKHWRHLLELRGEVGAATGPVASAVLLAAVCSAAGDAAGAESVLRQAVTMRPNEVVLFDALGRLLEKEERYGEAVEQYRAARALRPELGVALAKALREAGRAQEGEAVLRTLIEQQPKHPQLHFYLGLALQEQKKLAEAEATYRTAIALKPDYAAAYMNLGNAIAVRDRNQVHEALKAYRTAIALQPDDSLSYYNLGNALLRTSPAEAEAACRKALALRPDYAEAYSNLGYALWQLKRPVEAEAACRKALALRPGLAVTYANLSAALLDQNKQEEAEAACRKALVLRTDLAVAYNNLGYLFFFKNKLVEAEAACRKATALGPRDPVAYNTLGGVLVAEKKLAEAESAYRKAIALKDDYPIAHYNLGNIFLEQYQLAEAEGAFRKAIALAPDFAAAHNNLGVALRDQKKLVEAMAAFREATRLAPDVALYRDNLHEVERLLELERKLAACIQGKARPASPQEALDLSGRAAAQERYCLAVRLSADAFRDARKLADDLQAQYRYNAARYAALAAAGKGKEAGSLREAELTSLRHHVLDWLRADLEAYSGMVEKTKGTQTIVRERLLHWLEDTDLANVRGPDALAKLPALEGDAWKKLWADVDVLLKRGQQR